MNRVMDWAIGGVILAVGSLISGNAIAQFPLSGLGAGFKKQIFWHDNLDSGWRESQRTGRPMVIYITAAQCRYCDAMEQITWHDRAIETRVSEQFVAVQLSAERNARELNRIHVAMYPMTIVAVPQGKVVDHCKGFQPPELIIELLNRAASRH